MDAMKKPHARTSTVSPQQVAAFRLARHHLLAPKGNDPVAVCRHVCGIQAQLMTAARMNLAARTRGLSPNAIEAALWRDRTLVKSLSIRQTVHLLAAEDFPVFAAAIRRSRLAAVVRVMERLRITPSDREALLRATLESLEGGPVAKGELTRRIRPRVSSRVREWMDRVWNAARLALVEGLICYGPDCGQQVTFVRVDRWLPAAPRLTAGEAQARMLAAFLRAYGPATPRDFAKWSGLSAPEARAAWDAAGELAEVRVGGDRAWLVRADLPALRNAAFDGPAVRLLAAFDSYLLAHAEKEHLVESRYYKRVYRNQGWISPVVLVRGAVEATWEHAVAGDRLEITIHPFGTLPRDVRQGIEAEAGYLARFLGKPPAIAYARG